VNFFLIVKEGHGTISGRQEHHIAAGVLSLDLETVMGASEIGHNTKL
jgi:hypothetical protein